MRHAVDRHPALEADAHAAERTRGSPPTERRNASRPASSSAAATVDAAGDTHRAAVRDDGHDSVDGVATRRSMRRAATTPRSGAYGDGVDGRLAAATRSARMAAVPNDVVMPSPSWPAAIQSPGVPASGRSAAACPASRDGTRSTCGPRSGSASPGMNAHARSSMRPHHAAVHAASQPTSSRDEPISTCPCSAAAR